MGAAGVVGLPVPKKTIGVVLECAVGTIWPELRLTLLVYEFVCRWN